LREYRKLKKVDAPGIGAKIKEAREQDPRSVEELAKAAPMTRAKKSRVQKTLIFDP